MKLSTRLTAVAITAFALAGTLGAQGRQNGRSEGRAQAPRGGGGAESRGRVDVRPQRAAPARADMGGGFASRPAPRGGNAYQPRNDPRGGSGYAAARPDNRGGNGYAARPDNRGGNGYAARPDNRGGNGYAARPDTRGGNDFRGRVDPRDRGQFRDGNGFRGGEGRVPVAEHGRPLITRGGYVGGRAYGDFGGARVWRTSRFGGGFYFRNDLPYGWGTRIVFGSYFPMAYGSYCEAVPYDYEYLLPEMLPSYDPCLFGDRIVVFDRFSRSIVFVAAL